MKFTFEQELVSLEEYKKYELATPFETAALVVEAIAAYDKENKENFFEILQYLMGGSIQPISNLLKQQINDCMNQNEKWKFIGKSYFEGATNSNQYTPNTPNVVEVTENPYSYENEGFARLLLQSGGADSPRPITLRKSKDGKWYLWSDSILGLLADIRQPEEENPWA